MNNKAYINTESVRTEIEKHQLPENLRSMILRVLHDNDRYKAGNISLRKMLRIPPSSRMMIPAEDE